MLRVSEHRAWPGIGRALGTVAAALLCATALGQPNLAYAGHGGDGGGGHSGGGGFHGGGFGGFAVALRVCTMVSVSGTRVSANGVRVSAVA